MKEFYRITTTIKQVSIEDIGQYNEMIEIRLRTPEQVKEAISKGLQVYEKTLKRQFGTYSYYFINVDFGQLLEAIKRPIKKV